AKYLSISHRGFLINKYKHWRLLANYAVEYPWPFPQRCQYYHLIKHWVNVQAKSLVHLACHQNWVPNLQCLDPLHVTTHRRMQKDVIPYNASRRKIWDHPSIPNFLVRQLKGSDTKNLGPLKPWLHNKRCHRADEIYLKHHPLYVRIFYIS